MKFNFDYRAYIYGLLTAFAGGCLAKFIGMPLPWMLGPLFIIGFANGFFMFNIKSLNPLYDLYAAHF